MGALALSDLITEVTAGLGNRTEFTANSQRVVNGLNIAQQRLGRFYDYQEMKQILLASVVPVGDQSVDKYLILPTGIKSIHSLVLQDGANSQKLIEKPWRMFDKRIPLPEYIAPGWPTYYTRFGVQTAMLFPTPLQTFQYQLRATMLPTPFVLATPTMTSDFVDKDDIIIDWALEYLFRLFGRPDLADGYDHMALDRAKEAKFNDEDRPDMDASDDPMTSGGVTGPYWLNAFIRSSPVGGPE